MSGGAPAPFQASELNSRQTLGHVIQLVLTIITTFRADSAAVQPLFLQKLLNEGSRLTGNCCTSAFREVRNNAPK